METENKGNNMESGFQINALLLLESDFSRISNVQFGEKAKNDVNINTEVGVENNLISVTETVTVVQRYEQEEQVKIKVKMVGVFQSIGHSQLDDFEAFGRVNGAAIIFPYIREHITNLTIKAGIPAILLPPVNFTNNK